MAGFGQTFRTFAEACAARLASDVEAKHLEVAMVDGEPWYFNRGANGQPADGQWIDRDCNRWRRPGDTPLTLNGIWFGIECETLSPAPMPTPAGPIGAGCLDRLLSIGLGFKRLPSSRTPELCQAWGTDIHAPAGADCAYAMDASPRGILPRGDGQPEHLGDDPECFEAAKPSWEQDPTCAARDDCVDIGVWSPIEPGSATWVREQPDPARGYFAKFELGQRCRSRIRACLGDVCSPWRTLYQEE